MTQLQLLPQHVELLASSAISNRVSVDRGYRSVTTRAELIGLGFSERQARVPALLIPVWSVHGEIALYQVRPDEPRIAGGKPVKYETPRGARMVLDVPPSVRAKLRDPRVPLVITEAPRKADSAASLGLCCVALLGVWNWRGTNELGGKTALADWEAIALKGRAALIAFDSDVMTKPAVAEALERLKTFLEHRGADVMVIYLPPGEGGAKVGLDDYLAAGHGVDDLLGLATAVLRGMPPGDENASLAYRETLDGIVWEKPTANGPMSVPLTNFTARITAEVVEDDGAEQRRLFKIEARRREQSRSVQVSSAAFERMAWPTEQLGANAVIYPGLGTRDHARTAIQLLSGEVPERVVYTHLGWRQIGGAWVYLHAGGTIGTFGTVVEGIETRVADGLARYVLPEPPTGDPQVAAVCASLGLLNVAPDRISVPLLAAICRAVIGSSDFSLHLNGPTGVFKSELAALAQQHFGPGMDARNLPGSWSSTGNALEGLAFLAKDALLVVDDFSPSGSMTDVQHQHREADRVFRAQGNGSGRGRMRADASLRPVRAPRGLVLSTGEEVPRGQSLRARLLVLDVAPGDVDLAVLSACQTDAAAGLYALALSGFIRRLAGRYAEVRSGLRAEITRMRERALVSAAHRRTPEIVANLAIGMNLFLEYAKDVGAISADEHTVLVTRCWGALGQAAAAQSEHQTASEPTTRFRELLSAAITSGRAHVASEGGGLPANPGAWGWRRGFTDEDRHASVTWAPQGSRVGWVSGEDLYLDPDAAFAAAQLMGRDTNDPIAIAPKTLRQRMQEAGLLASVDSERKRLTVRRTLDGGRRAVLHVSAAFLEETSQTSQPSQSGDPHGAGVPSPWATPAGAPQRSAAIDAGPTGQFEPAADASAPNGPSAGRPRTGPGGQPIDAADQKTRRTAEGRSDLHQSAGPAGSDANPRQANGESVRGSTASPSPHIDADSDDPQVGPWIGAQPPEFHGDEETAWTG